MRPQQQRILLVTTLIVSALLLSGCFLRSLVGFVSFAKPLVSFSANSLAASCMMTSNQNINFICQYVITNQEGDVEFSSTGELIDLFGLLGLLIDPVILQVPEQADNFVANSQAGPQPEPLEITITRSFSVTPDTVMVAEPGHKFVILEFPAATAGSLPPGDPRMGTEFDFDLSFSMPSVAPVNLKAMLAGRVESGGKVYYIPLLPCVTDFSSLQTIQIPVGASPVDLRPQLLDIIDQGGAQPCNGQVYDFTTLTHYLPLVRKP